MILYKKMRKKKKKSIIFNSRIVCIYDTFSANEYSRGPFPYPIEERCLYA